MLQASAVYYFLAVRLRVVAFFLVDRLVVARFLVLRLVAFFLVDFFFVVAFFFVDFLAALRLVAVFFLVDRLVAFFLAVEVRFLGDFLAAFFLVAVLRAEVLRAVAIFWLLSVGARRFPCRLPPGRHGREWLTLIPLKSAHASQAAACRPCLRRCMSVIPQVATKARSPTVILAIQQTWERRKRPSQFSYCGQSRKVLHHHKSTGSNFATALHSSADADHIPYSPAIRALKQFPPTFVKTNCYLSNIFRQRAARGHHSPQRDLVPIEDFSRALRGPSTKRSSELGLGARTIGFLRSGRRNHAPEVNPKALVDANSRFNFGSANEQTDIAIASFGPVVFTSFGRFPSSA